MCECVCFVIPIGDGELGCAVGVELFWAVGRRRERREERAEKAELAACSHPARPVNLSTMERHTPVAVEGGTVITGAGFRHLSKKARDQ